MELLKILKNKKFIAAVIFLLLLNCISFYITQQKSIEESGTDINTYSAMFKENAKSLSSKKSEKLIEEKSKKFEVLQTFADTEELKSENTEGYDYYEYYAEEEARLIKEYPDLYKEYKSGKYPYNELSAQADFYSHFAQQIEYQNGYSNYIDSVLENSEKLSLKRLFADKNSYSYKSIQKSANDFSKNKNIKLSLVNDLPAEAVLSYHIGDFILILLCIFTAIAFASKKELNLLTNTCKNGRIKLTLKQLPVLVVFSLTASFLIYISEVIISLKIYCAPLDLQSPIQSCEMFKDCILHINFLQLFAVQIIFKALVAVTVSLVIWLLISVIGNVIFASAAAGVITAAELLLYKNISQQSSISFLKTFNIFSLFDYKSITQYNLVSVFSVPARAEIITWYILFIICIVAFVLLLLAAEHNYPIKSPKKIFSVLYYISGKLSDLYTKIQSLLYKGRYETFKIMHVGKGLVIITVFILITVFSFNTNQLVFSPTEEFLNDYYAKYSGELDSTVYDSIENMQKALKTVDDEVNAASRKYKSGKISLEEYELARAKSEAYNSQRNAVDKLEKQIERIKPLSKKGIKPVLINETGYSNLFFSQTNQKEILLLICAVILIFSSSFTLEKTSNMLVLNRSAKNGRNKLYFKKIFSVLPKTLILTAISYSAVILQNDYLYTLDHVNADIRNLECLQDVDLNLTIFEYIVLCFAFEFVFISVAGLITASLSAFMPQPAAIAVSSCAFILPSALYMIDVNSAQEVSAVYQFNFNSLVSDNGIAINSFVIHLALTAFCAAMLIAARKKWCLSIGESNSIRLKL